MRHLRNVGVAIFTFMLGIAAFLVYFGLRPVQQLTVEVSETGSYQSIHFYSVCELMNPRKSFNGQSIVTEATIYQIDDHVMVYPNSYCVDDADIFIWVQLDLTNYFGPNQELRYLLPNKKPFSEIDVRIYGTVLERKSIIHEKMNMIVPTKIELISPWRKFEPKAAA
jgi:hypothetical protein